LGAGKQDLLIWVWGKAFRQEKVDDRLAQSWAVMIGGRKLFQTVWLKVQPQGGNIYW
jgi:hypothetical protein